MRGKVKICVTVFPAVRITPAHAGKSIIINFCFISNWDHPRTCGEKHIVAQAVLYTKGSPPHMRGKVFSFI